MHIWQETCFVFFCSSSVSCLICSSRNSTLSSFFAMSLRVWISLSTSTAWSGPSGDGTLSYSNRKIQINWHWLRCMVGWDAWLVCRISWFLKRSYCLTTLTIVDRLGVAEGIISSEFVKESCGDFCGDLLCFGSWWSLVPPPWFGDALRWFITHCWFCCSIYLTTTRTLITHTYIFIRQMYYFNYTINNCMLRRFIIKDNGFLFITLISAPVTMV